MRVNGQMRENVNGQFSEHARRSSKVIPISKTAILCRNLPGFLLEETLSGVNMLTKLHPNQRIGAHPRAPKALGSATNGSLSRNTMCIVLPPGGQHRAQRP